MKKITSNQPNARAAFTLLELLTVITIISILTGLILVAIGGVRRRAAVAAVQAEMQQIEQSLTTFESRYGSLPPSNLVIPTAGSASAWAPESRSIVRGLWPQFDFATNGGLGNTSPIHLNGAECLVFFLGGVESGTTDAPVLSGFSKNPALPWQVSASSDGPIHEFDLGRMSDVDGDQIFEYLSNVDSATPLLYLSSRGKRYNKVNAPSANVSAYPNDDYDVLKFGDRARNLQGCYLGADGSAPLRADSFQLIYPGEDDEYGTGGVFPDPNDYATRTYERDNITNFSGGTFN